MRGCGKQMSCQGRSREGQSGRKAENRASRSTVQALAASWPLLQGCAIGSMPRWVGGKLWMAKFIISAEVSISLYISPFLSTFSPVSGTPCVLHSNLYPATSLSQIGISTWLPLMGQSPWDGQLWNDGYTDDRGSGQQSAWKDGQQVNKGLVLKFSLHRKHTLFT